ncbi:MAG: HAD family hydrolase [Lachnospiraceae bacterium]|nr:HAD family hydrolase [Lachnospiraceae bacterium]
MKAVIFDIDDTMISEYDYVMGGYRAVAKRLSRDEDIAMSEDEIFEKLKDLSKTSYKEVYNRFLDFKGIQRDEERVLELVDIYRHHKPSLKLYDDVRETLDALKARGIKLGIISDGDVARQKNKLKITDIENDFDCVIITDELGNGDISYRKPDERSYVKMAETLGVDFDEMLYVGDNPNKDFFIRTKLPIKTARIIREHGIYANAPYREDITEDFRIEKLTDVLNII